MLLFLFVVTAGMGYVGRVDTIGGTTFEDQGSGPAYQWVIRDPARGIHACWMYSATGSNWPDRNVRYNFYDYSTGAWNWYVPSDFMSSGTNSRSARCGYGTMAVMPADGAALVACHYSPAMMQFAPTALRDMAAGAGIFDECVGDPVLNGWFLPVVGVTADGTISLLLIKFQVTDNLYFSRGTTWCDWQNPDPWNQTGAFGHNLAASGQSNRLVATWMTGSNSELALSYRVSTDAGISWGDVQVLTPPSAYGGDTATVCFGGATVFFDRDDNWQLVTVLAPVVGESVYQNPAQVWCYNFGAAAWQLVHRAGAGSLGGGLGSSSICAKPSVGQNPATGRLYVAWEQFDSLNVEPSTNLLRADIWLTHSDDGVVWAGAERLTVPDGSSKRFPRLGTDCSGDSLAIGFLADSIAGFNSGGTGALSRNPICVWTGSGVGIAEQPVVTPMRCAVRPNPGARFTLLLGAAARAVEIRDVGGRLVRTLAAHDGVVVWDGCDRHGRRVEPGCYAASWSEGSRAGKVKLVKVR